MTFPSIRTSFISGLLLLAPVGVTIFVINLLVQRVGTPVRTYLLSPLLPDGIGDNPWIGWILSLISLSIVFVLICVLGWFSKQFFGRMAVDQFEKLVRNVPVVRTVYLTVKQIVDTFATQEKAVFQKCVLIEYPRRNSWVLGFLTSNARGEIQHRTENDVVNIFVPTTPNPTSGFLLMVPIEEVKDLQMTIADGMKLIISGGAVVPAYDPTTGQSTSVPFRNPEELPPSVTAPKNAPFRPEDGV